MEFKASVTGSRALEDGLSATLRNNNIVSFRVAGDRLVIANREQRPINRAWLTREESVALVVTLAESLGITVIYPGEAVAEDKPSTGTWDLKVGKPLTGNLLAMFNQEKHPDRPSQIRFIWPRTALVPRPGQPVEWKMGGTPDKWSPLSMSEVQHMDRIVENLSGETRFYYLTHPVMVR